MHAEQWNVLVAKSASPSGAFLQSWQWGQVEEACAKRVVRVQSNNTVAQAVWVSLPLGKGYWYVARVGGGREDLGDGRCPAEPDPAPPEEMGTKRGHDVSKELVRELMSEGQPAWVRWESFAPSGLVGTIIDPLQPKATWITDLLGGYEQILTGMQQKTRYNVRLAQKHGVQVEEVGDARDFLALMRETAKRDRFGMHQEDRYRAVLTHCDGSESGPRAFLVQASLHGEVLAGAIFLDWLGTRTYLYGASASTGRQHMAPHALHAWALEDACRRGLIQYDWWGISPSGAKKHQLDGVTRFKQGFPGERLETSEMACDVVKDRGFYRLYRLGQKVRRMV